MKEKLFIEYLNKIINEAICHGGDTGGAYFTNSEALVKEMKYFLRWLGLQDKYGIMDEDGWIRFYCKSDIIE